MSRSSIVIPRRFNGPPFSANGGYTCALLAAPLGASAEVTLRKPPPLDRALVIEHDEGEARLLDGELLLGSARIAEPDVSIPPACTVEEAQRAEESFIGFTYHHFQTCFVCGTARAHGDGLRLFTGKLGERDVVASVWRPTETFSSARAGLVDDAIVWSALDCPTYFAGRMAGYGTFAVLGRQTAKLCAPVKVGRPHTVVAWPIGKDGRKWEGGAAVFTAEGELCAYARDLWIEITPPSGL